MVRVLHLLVRHELHRSVRHTKQAGHESRVEAPETLLSPDLDQSVKELGIFGSLRGLETQTGLNDRDGVCQRRGRGGEEVGRGGADVCYRPGVGSL